MDKDDMYRVAFFLALIGLLTMYGSTFLKPESLSISDIEPEMVGDKVKVSGTVKNAKGGQHFFFDLYSNNSKIKAAKFDTPKEFTDGEEVTVTGEIKMYHGDLEIIAEKIRPR